MKRRSILPRASKILWGEAAGHFSFTGCRRLLVQSEGDTITLIGEQAHIVPHCDHPRAPRNDPSCPISERETYDNLILICRNHHQRIDHHSLNYSTDSLRRMKSEHESWVKNCLQYSIATLDSEELEYVARYIASGTAMEDLVTEGFLVVPPLEKMTRNHLTARVSSRLTMGLTHFSAVGRYVDAMALVDSEFPARLKAGFVLEYRRLREDEAIEGDELFFALENYSTQGAVDFDRMAAGITVLSYLFERCEVFES